MTKRRQLAKAKGVPKKVTKLKQSLRKRKRKRKKRKFPKRR